MSTETPLTSLSDWPTPVVQRMAACWITSVEQVVATASTKNGVRVLATEAGVSEDTMASLIESARRALTPERLAALEEPVDLSEFGFGALRPPTERGDDEPGST